VSACLAIGINDRGEIACVGRVASVPLPLIGTTLAFAHRAL
jgi:hypothetical protein